MKYLYMELKTKYGGSTQIVSESKHSTVGQHLLQYLEGEAAVEEIVIIAPPREADLINLR
jgi:hypothetical protein